jgi:NAD(P)-dependent dehydrogenase (short-subunit alcohol dehydrogenase family)
LVRRQHFVAGHGYTLVHSIFAYPAQRNASFIITDVSNADDCRSMVVRTVDTYGRIDIAFNNADVGRAGKLIEEEDEAGFASVLAVNLLGA